MTDKMVLEWLKDENGNYIQNLRPAFPGEIPDPVATEEMVNAERDRRLLLPFPFGGKTYQRDPQSVLRINGAVSMALAAMALGTAPDAALWVNGGPFQWITADNSIAELTPAGVIGLGMACAEVETRLVFAARTLKDMDPIPLNYTDDEHWE
jgi:hypothetical protein